MPFMEKVIWTLKPQGKITLATNEEWYVEEAKKFYLEDWRLKLIEDFSFTAESLPFPEPRTLFEKKYLERGEPCYQIVLSVN